jgi:Zn-dependent peptidase ImmA (M78 family)
MSREDVVAFLDKLVEELLGEAGLVEPPVDAIALAQKHLGMTVVLDSRQHERGRVQRAGRKPQIFLRPEPTEERHQWSVAHEIGKHLKDDIQAQLHLEPEQAKALTGESLNTLFSSRLLVPSIWFAGDAKDFSYNLLDLKQRYRTASHEVIALRFLDLPAPCVITVIDNDKIHRRKSNGPKIKTGEMEPAEARCQSTVHRTGEPCEVSEGKWTVQGWPVHQSDWKREILRGVVQE